MNEEQPTTPEEVSNEFLEPIIADLAGQAKGLGRGKGRRGGGKKFLAEKLSEKIGQHVRRESVESWLHPNPAKRTQPKLGFGLLLRRVWEKAVKPKTKRKKNGNNNG